MKRTLINENFESRMALIHINENARLSRILLKSENSGNLDQTIRICGVGGSITFPMNALKNRSILVTKGSSLEFNLQPISTLTVELFYKRSFWQWIKYIFLS